MVSGAARAQVDTEPLPRPITVYLADHSQVSVTFTGDYGPVRVTGSLDAAPKAGFKVTSLRGRSREVSWDEVRSLNVVQNVSEGFPSGSFGVNLITDSAPSTELPGTGYSARLSTTDQATWRILGLPEGTLTVRGEPYGTLAVPISRITAFQMEPIRGSVTDLPKGTVRLEILAGTTVNLPLSDVQLMQRDIRGGTATITLADDQTFVGKLVELPKVTLKLGEDKSSVSVPLERVALLERLPPGGRRL